MPSHHLSHISTLTFHDANSPSDACVMEVRLAQEPSCTAMVKSLPRSDTTESIMHKLSTDSNVYQYQLKTPDGLNREQVATETMVSEYENKIRPESTNGIASISAPFSQRPQHSPLSTRKLRKPFSKEARPPTCREYRASVTASTLTVARSYDHRTCA